MWFFLPVQLVVNLVSPIFLTRFCFTASFIGLTCLASACNKPSWVTALCFVAIVPFYNHFTKWSVTNSGIFSHILHLSGTFFISINTMLWIFDPKWGIWNSTTSNAGANNQFCGPAFIFLTFSWIFFEIFLKINITDEMLVKNADFR